MKSHQIVYYLLYIWTLGYSATATSIPFHETFETNAPMAGTPGLLDGQHGWYASTTNATVQSLESWEFNQAVRLGQGEISQTLDGTQSNIQVVFAWKPIAGNLAETDIPPDTTVAFWVNTEGILSAYSNQTVVEASGGVAVATSQWSRILVQSDYSSKKWSLWLDGIQVINNFDFYANNTLEGLNKIAFLNNTPAPAFLDDIQISTNIWKPQAGDTDGDGLDDSWELLFFHSPNILSKGDGNYDSDSMTDGEEEIAGTDPTDPNSLFKLTKIEHPEASTLILHWPSVENRLYDVNSCTNLQGGTWSNVESNMAATPPENVYTAKVNTAQTQFLQIQGRKQP